jgi:hypothetical protein
MTDIEYFRNFITKQCEKQGLSATMNIETGELISQGYYCKLPLLQHIGKTCDWRIVLFVVFLKNEQNNPLFEQLHKNLEICALNFSASRCRTDRLPELAFRFFSDSTNYTFEHLCADIERIANSGFGRNCQSYKTGLFRFTQSHRPYKNVPLTKYLLWQFDAEARKAIGFSELDDARYTRYVLITLDEVFQKPALSPIHIGIAGYAMISKAHWFDLRDAAPEQKSEILRKSDVVSTNEILLSDTGIEENIRIRIRKIIEFVKHYTGIQHIIHI